MFLAGIFSFFDAPNFFWNETDLQKLPQIFFGTKAIRKSLSKFF